MTITNNYSQQISPLKSAQALKCFVLLIVLLSFSVPSIADRKVINLQLLGIIIDFSYYQIFLIINSIWIVSTKSNISIGRIERILIILFFFIVPYNIFVAIVNDDHLFITSLRGIFNFGINVLCAFWIGYIIKKWLSIELFSLVFIMFGITLALSSIVEFSFLKFSPNLLDKFRSIVWGEIIEPDELLKAGGVILNSDGMARVGGLIGAPENLGVILAFTLPFTILSRISLLAHISIASLYTLVAVLASTRILGVALFIYIIIILQKFKGYIILKLLNVFIIISIIAGLIILGINNESYSRFTIEAFMYELFWRGEILTRFLEATKINNLSPLIGAGLGQFERDGNYDVIARVNSGILGGDVAVAYGLGGIGGILVLSVFWIEIWKIKYNTLNSLKYLRQANRLFTILVIFKSLFMPVFMTFVLISNILTFTSIAILMSLSGMIRKQINGVQDDS